MEDVSAKELDRLADWLTAQASRLIRCLSVSSTLQAQARQRRRKEAAQRRERIGGQTQRERAFLQALPHSLYHATL